MRVCVCAIALYIARSFMCGRSCLRSRNYVLSLVVCFFLLLLHTLRLSFVHSYQAYGKHARTMTYVFVFSVSKKVVSWESSFKQYRRVNCSRCVVNINVKYVWKNLAMPSNTRSIIIKVKVNNNLILNAFLVVDERKSTKFKCRNQNSKETKE